MDDAWSLMAAARRINRSGKPLDDSARTNFTPTESATVVKMEQAILNGVAPDARTEQLLRLAGVDIRAPKR